MEEFGEGGVEGRGGCLAGGGKEGGYDTFRSRGGD